MTQRGCERRCQVTPIDESNPKVRTMLIAVTFFVTGSAAGAVYTGQRAVFVVSILMGALCWIGADFCGWLAPTKPPRWPPQSARPRRALLLQRRCVSIGSMSSESTIYTDAYGDVTREQWDLYREFNVSPSDHDLLLEVYGRSSIGRTLILSAVREYSRGGQYSEFRMARAAQRRGDL